MIVKTSAFVTYTNSNTVASKSFSFRSKTWGNEKLFLATVCEFVYVKTALVFSMHI